MRPIWTWQQHDGGGYGGPWQTRLRPGSSNGRPVSLPAPYDKMEPTSRCEENLKVATWPECVDGGQQQWEAVQGPMRHSGHEQT
ncbi:unnamed protein product, partial [Staurois parvus]